MRPTIARVIDEWVQPLSVENQPINGWVVALDLNAMGPDQWLDLLDARQAPASVKHLAVLRHLPGCSEGGATLPLQSHHHPAGIDGLCGNQLQPGNVLHTTDHQVGVRCDRSDCGRRDHQPVIPFFEAKRQLLRRPPRLMGHHTTQRGRILLRRGPLQFRHMCRGASGLVETSQALDVGDDLRAVPSLACQTWRQGEQHRKANAICIAKNHIGFTHS